MIDLLEDLLGRRRRVAIEALLAAGGFAVALGLESPLRAAALIGLGYALRLALAADRRVRAWFFVGGLAWAASDVAFVRAGVFSYASPTWLGPPSYMPLLFGQLAVLTGTAVTAFGDRDRLPLWIDGALLGAATLAVVAFYDRGYAALAVAMPIALVGRAAAGRFEPRALLAAAVVGAVEPLIEMALIAAGLFSFSVPGPGGVPVWYWAYFGLASFAVRRAFVWSESRLRERQVTAQPSAG